VSDPPRTVLRGFVALPQAARDARTFTSRVLAAWKLSHLTETATLLVSELITNALAHSGGAIDSPDDPTGLLGNAAPVMLRVSLRETLLIEVWDQSPTLPIRRVAADDAESGRGLELVDMLSKEWGCNVLATGGKIVWFALETGRE
jgi:anti-sigma regulatory factor (Ser/Thr protein kinase)